LTVKQKEVINSHRRAARQNKVLTTEQKEEINAHKRVTWHNKTLDERNARHRASRQNISIEEKQEKNVNRRACRQSIPKEEREVLLDQCKANATARRNTPCPKSIAMPCPN
jgi:ribosomal protein L20A (L18A)